MPLVRQTTPNLVSGVSQQPAPMRKITATETADNAYLSIVSGLQKRPPSTLVGALAAATLGNTSAVHLVKREEDYKYAIVVTNGDIDVYDLEDGSAKTVTIASGTDQYLVTSNPQQNIRFSTVGDTTFILNRSRIVSPRNPTEDGSRLDPFDRASIFIKRAVASVTYAIYVDGVLEATFSTSDNTTAGTALEGTADIASELATDAIAKGNTNVGVIGSVLYFDIAEGSVVTVDEQFGGDAMEVILDHVNDFADLPPMEQEGRLVKVIGDPDEQGDDYWVYFDGQAWVETFGWEEARGMDNADMPHILVDNRDGTLDFGENTWADRPVGDSESNADPTFIGKKINGIFLFKGRMGFLSDENVIMSETSVFENFWRTTVAQLLDTDRIDVASNTGDINFLTTWVSFAKRLFVSSDKRQFELTYSGTLSPSSVGLEPVAKFESSTLVDPIDSGTGALFFYDGPRFSRVRELYLESASENLDSADLTIQVPKYIPNDIIVAAVNTAENVLVCLTDGDRDALYVYKWFVNGSDRIQSAWSRWQFPSATIKSFKFLDDELFILMNVAEEPKLVRMRIEESVYDADGDNHLLDYKQTQDEVVSVSYDSGTGLTTVTVSHETAADCEFWKTADVFGEPIPATRTGDDTYTLEGDHTSTEFECGVPYEFSVKLSQQFLRQQTPDGEGIIQDGRLQLRYLSIVYQDTTYFEVLVEPDGRDPRTSVFNAMILSDADAVLDTLPVTTGEFRVPILANSQKVDVTLKNDTPFPCAFSSMEWTAMYYPKARRIS